MINPIDIHLGNKLREIRTSAKMSQDLTGQLVGVTLQQIQKYETAVNRVSASRLYELAQIFEKPISSFFDGYVFDPEYHNVPFKSEPELCELEKTKHREVLDLKQAFDRIQSSETKASIIAMINTIAENQKI